MFMKRTYSDDKEQDKDRDVVVFSAQESKEQQPKVESKCEFPKYEEELLIDLTGEENDYYDMDNTAVPYEDNDDSDDSYDSCSDIDLHELTELSNNGTVNLRYVSSIAENVMQLLLMVHSLKITSFIM
eukprot:gene21067-23122_t